MFLTALLCGEIVDLPGGGVRHSNRESVRAGAATNNRDSYFSRGRIGQLLDICDRRRDRPYSETGADDPLSDRAPTFYTKVHFRHHVGFPIDIRNADAHYQGKPGLARDTGVASVMTRLDTGAMNLFLAELAADLDSLLAATEKTEFNDPEQRGLGNAQSPNEELCRL